MKAICILSSVSAESVISCSNLIYGLAAFPTITSMEGAHFQEFGFFERDSVKSSIYEKVGFQLPPLQNKTSFGFLES